MASPKHAKFIWWGRIRPPADLPSGGGGGGGVINQEFPLHSIMLCDSRGAPRLSCSSDSGHGVYGKRAQDTISGVCEAFRFTALNRRLSPYPDGKTNSPLSATRVGILLG